MLVKQLIKQGGSLLSRNRLIILTYHRVFARKDPVWPYDVDAVTFEVHLQLLKQYFNVLPLAQALDRLASGDLPDRAVCITFDDGYADNYQVAYPLLKKYGLTATFFIATGYLQNGIMWNDVVIESIKHYKGERLDLSSINLGLFTFETNEDRTSSIMSVLKELKYKAPDMREELVRLVQKATDVKIHNTIMMTDVELREMHRNGMQIGAHTQSHPILSSLSDDDAYAEISQSKLYLEGVLDSPVEYFAYPNGKPVIDYTQSHVEMLKALGFKAAVSTAWGFVSRQMDKFQAPRIVLWGSNQARMLKTLLLAYRQAPKGLIP